MLEYERIDISEGININKTNLSKECDLCHYWYFNLKICKILNHQYRNSGYYQFCDICFFIFHLFVHVTRKI